RDWLRRWRGQICGSGVTSNLVNGDHRAAIGCRDLEAQRVGGEWFEFMSPQALVVARELAQAGPILRARRAIKQLVITHRFRLRRADHLRVEAVLVGQGEGPLEAAVESDLDVAEGLRLVPFQIKRHAAAPHWRA